MKVNFDSQILGLDGLTPIKAGPEDGATNVTLGMVCAMALMNDGQDTLDKKLKAFKLLQKIVATEGKNETLDIDSEQIALLKEKVGVPGFQNLVVVGRVVEALTE